MKSKHKKLQRKMKRTGNFVAYHVSSSLIRSVVYHTVGSLFKNRKQELNMKNNKTKRELNGLDVTMGFLAGLVIGTFFGIITTVAIYLQKRRYLK